MLNQHSGRVAARRRLTKLGLAIEASVALSAASLAVRLLPSATTTRLLGRPLPASVEERRPPGLRATRVGRAVEGVASALPWRPLCLPQALAVRLMLRRRGIPCRCHLGVVQTSPLSAHAWVTVAGSVVQGGPVGHATEVASFR